MFVNTVSIRALRRALACFSHQESGGIAILFAVLAPVLIGFAALGVDTGVWYKTQLQAQTAADSAALSAAYEIASSRRNNVSTAALRSAADNGFTSANGTVIAVNSPPTSGAYAANTNAVEVVVQVPARTFLSGIVGATGSTIEARAVAVTRTASAGNACVLALDQPVSAGVEITGSTVLNFPGCVIASNSTDSEQSINISGHTDLTAASLYAVGGINHSGSSVTHLTSPETTHASAVSDPYADLTVGTLGGCSYTDKRINGSTVTLSPGNYCGGLKLTGQADVRLNPGTYYMSDGDFDIGAQAKISCNCGSSTDGVTIVLTTAQSCTSNCSSIGKTTINGGATVNLRAPSSDSATYKGVAFYQDRRAPNDGTNKFNGGSTMTVQGAIYFPKQKLEWTGNNGSSAATCTQIIGGVVYFLGDAKATLSECGEAGIRDIQIPGSASLVE